CVARQQPDGGGGHVVREGHEFRGVVRRRWGALGVGPEASEPALGPTEALVEVAEVAGVGRRRALGASDGAGDAMRPDALEERIGRARHVAVVTEAAARFGRVVRVLADAIGVLRVALGARLGALFARRQLIVRIALVHRVAGDARELLLSDAPLEAGALHEPVVLAPADADRAVGPEYAVEPTTQEPFGGAVLLVVDEEPRRFEVLTRTKAPRQSVGPPFVGVEGDEIGVTLAAHRAGLPRGEARGLHDLESSVPRAVARQRALILGHVGAPRP